MLISFGYALLTASLARGLTLYNGREGSTTASSTSTGLVTEYTGLAAYDPLVLTPPPPPSPATGSVSIAIPVDPSAQGNQLSIPQRGNFLGFSIELSVAVSVMGLGPRNLKPVFLNYMANIQNRAGRGPVIRVGGNTQDRSTLFVDGLPDGGSIQKVYADDTPTSTPTISYSQDLLWTMANISGLVGAEWYFGLAFNQSSLDSDNVPLAAGYTQQILGSSLRGLALGNEPDLYARHTKRPADWGMSDYVSEFNSVRAKIMDNEDVTNQATLMGPSVCCNVENFELADVFNSQWLSDNIDYLTAVTVQHYPHNNCGIDGKVTDPQSIFTDYLNHTSVQRLTAPYLDGAALAQANGKEMLMLEFNTASCGGFPGLSDSFGAALWLTDWALQLAWGNFSTALMHVGGQNVYYNPFTPPPFESIAKQWTTGSIYYSTLVVAEAFGRSGTAQVIDLLPNAGDMYHPAYVVYDGGMPVRVILFNYVSDESGGSTYNAQISLTDIMASFDAPTAPAPGDAPAVDQTSADQTTDQVSDQVGGVVDQGITDQATEQGTVDQGIADQGIADQGVTDGATTEQATTPPADQTAEQAAAQPAADQAADQPQPQARRSTSSKRAPLSTDRVWVRYLRASNVAEQYNITWAGQTMGYSFASDGRLFGDRVTEEYACSDGVCTVPVPAPAIAVVFLTQEALTESTETAEATATYATTVVGTGTALIDLAAQKTGNGVGPFSQDVLRKGGSDRRAQLPVPLALAAAAAAMGLGLGVV